MRSSAEAVAKLAEGLGIFESVSIESAAIGDSEEHGQPAVLASRPARNGAPSILLYAHHDVQPPGKEEDWSSPIFEPTLRGERLYGRGASDDKAGVISHIAALRAFVAAVGTDFDLGISLFVEGEEEFGSRSFANFLRDFRDRLEADVIVVADSDNWSTEIPAITVALRGNVTFRLSVRTLEHASHSGMYGGAVPDAMMALIRTLDSLWDDRGKIAVPGLVTHDMATPEYDEAQLRSETGLVETASLVGEGSIPSRLWAQPSITVTGIDAPTVANASNTLVPEASVRVSARIAPGQDAEAAYRAIEKHLRDHAGFGASLTFDDVDTGSPFLVDTSGWAIAMLRESMTDAWGAEPMETGIGGSIPFVADLVREFPAAQILVTGVEDPDTRAHSPNESQHLGVLRKAIASEADFLVRLEQRER